MFGSGFIEMLARQMTRELQAIRDRIPPGARRWLPKASFTTRISTDGIIVSGGYESLRWK